MVNQFETNIGKPCWLLSQKNVQLSSNYGNDPGIGGGGRLMSHWLGFSLGISGRLSALLVFSVFFSSIMTSRNGWNTAICRFPPTSRSPSDRIQNTVFLCWFRRRV